MHRSFSHGCQELWMWLYLFMSSFHIFSWTARYRTIQQPWSLCYVSSYVDECCKSFISYWYFFYITSFVILKTLFLPISCMYYCVDLLPNFKLKYLSSLYNIIYRDTVNSFYLKSSFGKKNTYQITRFNPFDTHSILWCNCKIQTIHVVTRKHLLRIFFNFCFRISRNTS